jgi:hypothetical protein
MEAILKFNLPEETSDFELAVNAVKMYSIIWSLDQWLRTNTKYASDNISSDTYKAYEQCRERLHELMTDYNISFD